MDHKDPLAITETDVRFYFGDAYATRGDILERNGAVRDFAFDKDTLKLTAVIKGTREAPYQTMVQLGKSMHGIVDVRCSCPIAGFCKHSAALAFYAVRSGALKHSVD